MGAALAKAFFKKGTDKFNMPRPGSLGENQVTTIEGDTVEFKSLVADKKAYLIINVASK